MALVSVVPIALSFLLSFLVAPAWDMGFADTPMRLGEADLLALQCGVPEGGDDDELAGAADLVSVGRALRPASRT
jgi:hypothetical protein